MLTAHRNFAGFQIAVDDFINARFTRGEIEEAQKATEDEGYRQFMFDKAILSTRDKVDHYTSLIASSCLLSMSVMQSTRATLLWLLCAYKQHRKWIDDRKAKDAQLRALSAEMEEQMDKAVARIKALEAENTALKAQISEPPKKRQRKARR